MKPHLARLRAWLSWQLASGGAPLRAGLLLGLTALLLLTMRLLAPLHTPEVSASSQPVIHAREAPPRSPAPVWASADLAAIDVALQEAFGADGIVVQQSELPAPTETGPLNPPGHAARRATTARLEYELAGPVGAILGSLGRRLAPGTGLQLGALQLQRDVATEGQVQAHVQVLVAVSSRGTPWTSLAAAAAAVPRAAGADGDESVPQAGFGGSAAGAPAVAAEPAAPPAQPVDPGLPTLPYRYGGTLVIGGQAHVLLVNGDNELVVRPGELVENTWLLESRTSTALRFRHHLTGTVAQLPLQEPAP